MNETEETPGSRSTAPKRASSSPDFCCCSACSAATSPCGRCARPSAPSSAARPRRTCGFSRRCSRILIVPFYGWLVAHVRRSVLLPTIYGFMSVAFVVTAQVFESGPPDPMVARVFYVGISVMNLLLVSVFWSFMLEILLERADQAAVRLDRRRRHAGALVGPGATAAVREEHRQRGRAVSRRRHVPRGRRPATRADGRSGASIAPEAARSSADTLSERERALGGNPFAGFMLVLRNPVPDRHRAVHRRHLGHQHLPVFRAARAGRGASSRSSRRARRCSPASTPSCRRWSSSRSCRSPASSPRASASSRCW